VPLLAISFRRHCVFGLSVCAWSYTGTKSLWTRCLTNILRGFQQILDAVADNGELFRFWDQGHSEIKYGQISSVGHIFSLVSGLRGLIWVKFITVTHCRVYMTWIIFWMSWVQRSRSDCISGRGKRYQSFICFIIDSASAKIENTLISVVISEHYYVACLWLFSPSSYLLLPP